MALRACVYGGALSLFECNFWLIVVLFALLGTIQWAHLQQWFMFLRICFRIYVANTTAKPLRRISHRKARSRFKRAYRLQKRLLRMTTSTFAGGLTALTFLERIAFPCLSAVMPSPSFARTQSKRRRACLPLLDLLVILLLAAFVFRVPPAPPPEPTVPIYALDPDDESNPSGSRDAPKFPDSRRLLLCRRLQPSTILDADPDDVFFDCLSPDDYVAFASPGPRTQHTEYYFDSDSYELYVDPCASACASPHESDFVNLTPVQTSINGIGKSGVAATHKGTLRWIIEDDNGLATELLIPDSFYAPGMGVRLFAPHFVAQQLGNNMSYQSFTWDGALTWTDHGDQRTRTIGLDPSSNVPIMRSAGSFHQVRSYLTQAYSSVVVSDDEDDQVYEGVPYETPASSVPATSDGDAASDGASHSIRDTPLHVPWYSQTREETPDAEPPPNLVDDPNVPEDQRTLLHWHHRLGHVAAAKLRTLAELGWIPRRLANCRLPMCPECRYGKAHRRPWRTKGQQSNIASVTRPGQCVSVDQMESSTPGFVAQNKGTLTKGRYRVATIFVDHFSGLDFVHLQRTASAEETLEAKAAFERFAATHGVRVMHYHADNGRFADNAWKEACRLSEQGLTFCGVGAHHQNGVAERRIRDLTEHARSMLFHAAHRWPKAVTTHLWPYALRMASEIRRSMPRSDREGKAPIQLFSSVEEPIRLKHFHPFGCPVYVLSDHLQSAGGQQPKWDERSRIGIYLGHSPAHASSVGLVLNPLTGLVSPQFHLIFDDHFDVVDRDAKFRESLWQHKSELIMDPSSPSPASDHVDQVIPSYLQTPWDAVVQENEGALPNARPSDAETSPSPNQSSLPSDDSGTGDLRAPPSADGTAPPSGILPPDASANSNLRRSQRSVRLTSAARESHDFPTLRGLLTCLQGYMSDEESRFVSFFTNFFAHEEHVECLIDGTPNSDGDNPVAFATKADPDTLHLSDCRKEPDWPLFREAMEKEVRDHEDRGHWKIVPASDVPKDNPPIASVWSFKRKRIAATGHISKRKARLCAHGGQQTYGVNFWETYSPVVTWYSIRAMLIVALINDWHTRQLDFVLAFPQADLKVDIYMKIPWGFNAVTPDGQPAVLKLVKNLYGLSDAGLTWFKHLKSGLLKRGFKESLVDPCVFYRNKIVLLCYVDDCIILGPDAKEIDKLIRSLSQSYVMTDEGSVSNYLGIHIEKNGKTIAMTQPHLIRQIIEAIGLKDNSTMHDTPATEVLGKRGRSEEEDRPFDAPWSYRSVLGKLSYLQNTTRPDIAMAVHQCARFSNDPRQCHQKAIKRIARYLKRTATKGIILRPSKTPEFVVYVDADFCGGYKRDRDTSDDPTSALSRTGYIIMYMGCPIAWSSKMQTEITLSTTEAEYVALSSALRSVIPLVTLFQEAKDNGIPIPTTTPTVKCTVFEDNSGALELATAPKMRPRTKHINIKYHHFREHVRKGTVKIQYVPTALQVADQMTKPLPAPQFTKLRKLLMGW